uniref:Uncharacterized protein n=1 Tax=Nelumbo nucifera TaxID=4432 RepID=A0A822ZBH9_NELNU|nr:TPA_asm: hypothetical protein HUJ06_016213 [Nelumbo nucifera]
MGSGWRRTVGNVRSFVGNSMGGLTGGSNLAAWVVAGTLAYFLWVKPSQDLKREQEVLLLLLLLLLLVFHVAFTIFASSFGLQERAALAAASDRYRYVEKRKPIPDPQETGLIYGKKNTTKKLED